MSRYLHSGKKKFTRDPETGPNRKGLQFGRARSAVSDCSSEGCRGAMGARISGGRLPGPVRRPAPGPARGPPGDVANNVGARSHAYTPAGVPGSNTVDR